MGVRESLVKSAARGVASLVGHGRLQILIYHSVLAEADPLRPQELTVEVFDWQMRLMADAFHVLSLSEACRRLGEGTLPARAACITFDDGYADNAEIAVPILQRYDLPATFFVASGFLNGGRMWNDTVIEVVRRLPENRFDFTSLGLGVENGASLDDRYKSATSLCSKLKHMNYDERLKRVAQLEAMIDGDLPQDLMMTSEHVRAICKVGMEIGAHTVSHPILAKLDDDRCMKEIVGSKQALEEITGHPVSLFAYPNGMPGRDYEQRHVAMVKRAGFAAAVSTCWGVATEHSDKFELPRFTPWQRAPEMFYLALAMNYFKWTRADVA